MTTIRESLDARAEAEWRAREKRKLIWRIVRWCFAVPMITLTFGIVWFGPFLMLLGIILITPDIAQWLSCRWDTLLWSHRAGDATPLYSIPESLVARGRYVEAEQEYEKIIREFPNEVKPHVDLINIAVTRLHNAELAGQLYQRGMGLLRDDEAKQTLTRMYEAILSRLEATQA